MSLDHPVFAPPSPPIRSTLQDALGDAASPSGIMRYVLEPLCEETADLLRPANLQPHDVLEISLDSGDPDWFVLQAFHRNASLAGERLAASWGALASLTRIPEATKLDDFGGTYQVAATDITVCILSAAWPTAQIEFKDESAKLVYEKLLLQTMHQTYASRQRAKYRIEKELPQAPEGWLDNPDNPLEDFQKVPAITFLGQTGSGMFMDRGTGKTATFINRVMNEASEKRKTDPLSMYYAIVVCPKNVRMNWQREVQKFATLKGRVTVLRGTLLDRMKLLNEILDPDPTGETLFCIVIINYESVSNTFEGGLGIVPWDLAGLDESHEIKSTYAKIYKTAWALRDVSESRTCMTGTPITNSLLDLFTQLEFMGRGFSGFNNWSAFKKFYGKWEKDYSGRMTLAGFQNLPFLQERLSRLCYMITLREAMPQLPATNWDIREVSMGARQRELYKAMQKRLIQEIDEKTGGGSKTVTADCILTMLLRLSQITSGFVSWDPVIDENGELLQPKKVEYLQENPKLDMLVAEIKASPNKVLVWSCWIPSIQMISARLIKEGINHGVYYGNTKEKDREELEASFNNDRDMKVFLGNPAAGGMGINLWGYNPSTAGQPYDHATKTGDHGLNADLSIYYDENWSMVTRSQSEARPVRRGTRVPHIYRTLICPSTIDQEIYDRVMKKISDAASLQDVKEIMKRVLSSVLLTD